MTELAPREILDWFKKHMLYYFGKIRFTSTRTEHICVVSTMEAKGESWGPLKLI